MSEAESLLFSFRRQLYLGRSGGRHRRGRVLRRRGGHGRRLDRSCTGQGAELTKVGGIWGWFGNWFGKKLGSAKLWFSSPVIIEAAKRSLSTKKVDNLCNNRHVDKMKELAAKF